MENESNEIKENESSSSDEEIEKKEGGKERGEGEREGELEREGGREGVRDSLFVVMTFVLAFPRQEKVRVPTHTHIRHLPCVFLYANLQ